MTAGDAWLVLSSAVGALFGATVKYLYEEVARSRRTLRHETRRVIDRYTAPLVRSAEALERRINILVRNEEKRWFEEDEYVRLSTLYVFGEHLGWIRIIEREFGFLPYESSRGGQRFNSALYGLFKALTSHAYFRWHSDQDAVAASAQPRLVLSAVGEVMTADTSPPRTIEFTDFVRQYANDEQFRRWFGSVEELFSRAHPADPLRWDRLIAAGASLRKLVEVLDPRAAMTRRAGLANLDLLHAPEVRALLVRDNEG